MLSSFSRYMPRLFLLIFGFYYIEGIASEFEQEAVGCIDWIDAYPMFGRFVVRIANTSMLRLQFIDALWLTFERDDREVVAVEERKHVATDIEDKHSLSVFEFLEREFLFHIIAQRQAILAIIFYVHF